MLTTQHRSNMETAPIASHLPLLGHLQSRLNRLPRTTVLKIAICLALGLGTLVLYAPARHYYFVNYDDNDYVTENPYIARGLGPTSVGWAFTHFYASNWHPLTWISHMVDRKLWGLHPGGHHLTSVLLHVISAVLIFLVFADMTGTLGRSAFVAAVFAWHPLHVESVAWVSERKDVLCAFFWILTMGAYVRYTRREGTGPYLVVVGLLACTLMSKPMGVTLPFVLLLLDWWPLRRAEISRRDVSKWRQLVLEKIPLFLLAAASSILTYRAQQSGGSVISIQRWPVLVRLGHAMESYVVYIWKAVWPTKLAPIYPMSPRVVLLQIFAAFLALFLISALSFRLAKKWPFLLFGWLWFVGTLVPVIGIVQVGGLAGADRYMYLPIVGLSVITAWGATVISERLLSPNRRRLCLALLTFVTLTSYGLASARQLTYWRDSEELWKRALLVAPDNEVEEELLGAALAGKGRFDEAIPHLNRALQLKPEYAEAHNNLGAVLFQKGQIREAIAHWEKSLETESENPDAQNDLAWVFATYPDASIRDGERAVKLGQRAAQTSLGNDPMVLRTLSAAYAEIGQYSEAVRVAKRALELAAAQGNSELGKELRKNLQRYESKVPLRSSN